MHLIRLSTYLAAVLLCCVFRVQAQYKLVDNWSQTNFFGNFDFFTAADPNNGWVQYVDAATANAKGYTTAASGKPVYIGVDHTNAAPWPGRQAVRLTSKKTYNGGLFIFDVVHMPFGCGTWPSIWTVGPNWPTDGEIDLIEGTNTQTTNLMSLHTAWGATCQMTTSRWMTGKAGNIDCEGYNGCGVTDTRTTSYGSGFNAGGGGVFAIQWLPATITPSGIRLWFWPRGSIPSDILASQPNPANWGMPAADFPTGTNCTPDHFVDHQIIIDITFCGTWANQTFGSFGCPGSCTTYVQNNPAAFAEAYWSINYIQTYQL